MEKIKSKYLIVSYYLFFIGCFLLYSYFRYGKNIITEGSLLNFDAEHYYTISFSGYFQKLVAFFPLFPYTWKYSGLSIVGICIFNALCYFSGLILLKRTYGFSNKLILFFLTVPSTIFMFLPYSEAMFFILSCVVLYSLRKENYLLFYITLFIIGFARPTASVFVIALVLMFAYRYCIIEKKPLLFIAHALLSTAISLFSFYMVLMVEYRQTGHWMSFFYYQKVEWGNFLQFPKIHLGSWGSRFIHVVDGVALISGIGLIIYFFYLSVKAVFKQKKDIDTTELFSYLYLIGMSLIVLLFRGGMLFSLNRFFFCSAFFFVAFYFIYQKLKHQSALFLIGGFLLMNIFWMLFGSYLHFSIFIFYIAASLYLTLYLLLKNNNVKVSHFAYIAIIACNIAAQIILLEKFLLRDWVA